MREGTPTESAEVMRLAGAAPTAEARSVVALSGGRLAGGVVYDRWTESAVEMHMALPSPIAVRALLRPAFAFPFLQAQKRVLMAWVRASNKPSVRLVTHVGFRWCGSLSDGATVGEDMLLFQMRREDCRWIAERKAA